MSTIANILMVKGPDVIVAGPNSTVMDAARLMAEANVGSVIVKDGDELLGIFTERDLLRRVVVRGKAPDATPLSDVMSAPLKTCGLEDSVQDVVDCLTREHIRHLAVVEDGALVGAISLRDVMAAQLRDMNQKIRDIEERTAD